MSPFASHGRRPVRRAAVLLFAVGLTACGGDSAQDFATCGNGTLDTGEVCDDGNLVDTDLCTSACQPARCGDGVVLAGVEACDGSDLRGADCGSLGFSGLRPACNTDCQIDPSPCGPAFTPTATPPPATASASATATPSRTPTLEIGVPTFTPTVPFTPTPTPTATPDPCGDGLLEADETCDTCPADCVPAPCEPSGTEASFDVLLQPLQPQNVINASIRLAYRSSVVSIPGTRSAPSVNQRVTAPPPLPAPFVRSDADYALIVVIGRASPPLRGRLFTVRFDVCTGAPEPTSRDLTCFVDGCAGAGGPLACTCSVAAAVP